MQSLSGHKYERSFWNCCKCKIRAKLYMVFSILTADVQDTVFLFINSSDLSKTHLQKQQFRTRQILAFYYVVLILLATIPKMATKDGKMCFSITIVLSRSFRFRTANNFFIWTTNSQDKTKMVRGKHKIFLFYLNYYYILLDIRKIPKNSSYTRGITKYRNFKVKNCVQFIHRVDLYTCIYSMFLYLIVCCSISLYLGFIYFASVFFIMFRYCFLFIHAISQFIYI